MSLVDQIAVIIMVLPCQDPAYKDKGRREGNDHYKCSSDSSQLLTLTEAPPPIPTGSFNWNGRIGN